MADFHDPAARTELRVCLLLSLLLPSRPDMWLVAMVFGHLATLWEVVPLVRTQMLWLLLGRLRSVDHDRFERLRQELHIVPIRSGDHEGDRDALALSQDAAFGTALATVRRVRARGFLAKGALVIAPSMLCQVHSSPWRSS